MFNEKELDIIEKALRNRISALTKARNFMVTPEHVDEYDKMIDEVKELLNKVISL